MADFFGQQIFIVVEKLCMSFAERMKMFENAAPAQEGPVKTAPARRWGVSKQPSTTELIQKVADNDPSLTTIDISNNAAFQIKAEEYTTQLSNALKKNKYVKELRLENCGLGDREGILLGEALAENTSLVLLDLCKNKINNEGGSALARGLTHNKSLVTLDLMSMAKTRWGDQCLECFISMFEHNITLLKINWRLESRKSFALNKMLTRNNEIERRKKSGMPYQDCLPTSLKTASNGAASVSPSSPPPAAAPPPSTTMTSVAEGSPGETEDKENADPTSGEEGVEEAPAHAEPSVHAGSHPPLSGLSGPLSASSHFGGSFGSRPPSDGRTPSDAHTPVGVVRPRADSKASVSSFVSNASHASHASQHSGAPRSDMPRVRRAGASVLARWPPAQLQEQST